MKEEDNSGDERLFLMDLWKSEIIQKLIQNEQESKNFDADCTTGSCIWSPKFERVAMLIEDIVPSTNDAAPSGRAPRAAKSRCTADQLYQTLLRPEVDPHLLVEPYKFGDALGVSPNAEQPYRVEVHPQVALLCDIHSHLSEAEIIGFLAGKWDPTERIVYIQAVFPCCSTIRDDNGNTDVELDAESEYFVRDAIEKLGMIAVGWYHSHPKFRPSPSIIDLQNQYNYQQMFQDPNTALQPFVGLIISTMEQNNMPLLSHHQWFSVKRYEGKLCGAKDDVPMPLHIEVRTAAMHFHCPFDLPSKDETVVEMLSKLQSRTEDTLEKNVENQPSSGAAEKGLLANNKTKHITEFNVEHASSSSKTVSKPRSKTVQTAESDTTSKPDSPQPAGKSKYTTRERKTQKLNDAIKSLLKSKKQDDEELQLTVIVESRKRGRPPGPAVQPRPPPAAAAIAIPPSAETSSAREDPSKPAYASSLIASITHSELQSSHAARELIAHSRPDFLYMSLTIVCLGFYYSRYRLRCELHNRCFRRPESKLEKLQLSSARWMQLFCHADRPQSKYMLSYQQLVSNFLSCCWDEFSKLSGKVKQEKKRQKPSGADSVVLPSATASSYQAPSPVHPHPCT